MHSIKAGIKIRRSLDRGHANHGWLDSYHSFSFANYYDPAHMGYSVLRVINEDVISPSQGFGMHPHRDMEIVTYMLEGTLSHQDSIGNGSAIRAGDVQRMSAGTGVRHSEFNASDKESAHLLQIWLIPEVEGITPSYEEKHFSIENKTNQWCLIASCDARNGSLLVHQDIDLFTTLLGTDRQLDYQPESGRSLYLQIARGQVVLNGLNLAQGDAATIDGIKQLEITAQTDAEILLFDLPSAALYQH